MEKQGLEGGLEVLEAELAETENSAYHLVRSNVELAQYLNESPGDEDLERAVEENKAVLVRKRHRIKSLRLAISDLRTQRPHLAAAAPSSAVPVTAGATMASDLLDVRSAGRLIAIDDGRAGSGVSSDGSFGHLAASSAVLHGGRSSSDMVNLVASSMSFDAAATPTPPSGSNGVPGKNHSSGEASDTDDALGISASAKAAATGDTCVGSGDGGVLL